MIFNTDIITAVILFLLIICAIFIVFSQKMIHAVVYLGTFSTLCALVFLLLGAPDVALAEAIIGSTISTIVYLIAINKYRLFIIYSKKSVENELINETKNVFFTALSSYLKDKEMYMHVIETDQSVENLSGIEDHNLIVDNNEKQIILHSNCQSAHTENIKKLTEKLELKAEVIMDCQKISYETPYSEVSDEK